MSKKVTRFVVNYYILPIDANANARQNVVIITFCNVTTFWVATDRHSRSTGVNPSRKQRCCYPSCLWSQAQRDTFDQDNSQSLGFWLTIRHRCICMWSWIEMLIFLSSWVQRLYEFRFVWVQKYVGYERGTICANWNADYLLENLSPKDHQNVVD